MAARASLDDKLAAIRALRGQALTPEQKTDLRMRIGDRSNLIVAAAAALALGAVGAESAGLILRLKVRVGDRDPDVLSECLGGLLTVDPKENLPIVTEFLDPSNAAACEAAAMALGKSRLAEALDPLRGCLGRCHSAELRQHILLAVAILRRPAAIDFLLEHVSTE